MGASIQNVDDLVRWDALLRARTLIDGGSLRGSRDPPVRPGALVSMRFGWFVDRYRGEKRWRHTGETSGFRNAITALSGAQAHDRHSHKSVSGEPQAIGERIADRLFR